MEDESLEMHADIHHFFCLFEGQNIPLHLQLRMVFNNGLLMFREGALIAVWGGRNLLDAGGSHFIVELLVVPLR